MLISVIVPVYNVEKYIKQCLDSIINQPFKDIEIICIDDCSTDSSKEILESYAEKDSRIRLLENDKNLGVGLTRNIGLQHAQGDYIHFVDPDDWLIEDAYNFIAEKIHEFPDVEMFYYKYKTYDGQTKEIFNNNFNNELIAGKILNPQKDNKVFDNWDRYCWLKIFKKDFLINNNILFKYYKSLSDIEWSAIIYTTCNKMMYVDKPIINYRRNRVGSLVTIALDSWQTTILQFKNNMQIYKILPEAIKTNLTEFDYNLASVEIYKIYKNKNINIIKAICMLCEISFNYTVFKILLRRHCKFLFYTLLRFKQKLYGKI